MAIKIKDLDKYYGKTRGVVNLNLQVEPGEIFGFIGPNGAGKSTTIRVLLNMIWPSRGSATIFGLDCNRDSPRIKKQIGYVPSEVNYYPAMTNRQIMEYVMRLRHVNAESQIGELCERLDISPQQRFGNLSLGNKKKVAIAQALFPKPRLLIMDEPTNGLDPLMQNRLEQILREENQQGTTIFLSSHNLNEVQRLCNRVAIIKEGSIVEICSMEKMLAQALRKVIVEGNNLTTQDLQVLQPVNLTSTEKGFSFAYSGNINDLLRVLSSFELNNITIGEPSLEGAFIKFYTKENA